MKYFFYTVMLSVFLSANEQIDQNIKEAQSIDELTRQMNQAPKQYRHRHIQAIKERSMYENQEKRKLTMQSLEKKNKEMIANEHINALTGYNGGNNASSNAHSNSSGGSGSGSGSGSGGHGGGNGRGGGNGNGGGK
ncbi:MAG: hypothetical protein PHR87_05435 [Sulfurospirillaceae bacterium]|nr:hypothetical protein [Sulfurospirillaceae bacterium]